MDGHEQALATGRYRVGFSPWTEHRERNQAVKGTDGRSLGPALEPSAENTTIAVDISQRKRA